MRHIYMDDQSSRREFISTIGSVTIGVFGSAIMSQTVQASGPTAKGQIVPEVDTQASNDEVNFRGPNGSFAETTTDMQGNFEVSIPEKGQYDLAIYKSSSRNFAEQEKNGIPQVYQYPRSFRIDEDVNDFGKISLPEGYLVDVRVVDEDETPLSGASPEIRHNGYGFGGGYQFNEDGYLQHEDASFTGIEIRDNLSVGISPPPDRVYEKGEFINEFFIDEPSEIIVTLSESEATWDVSKNGQPSTTTVEPTTTQTTETTTTTVEPTTTQTTETTTTTVEPTTTQTTETTTTTVEPTTTQTTETTTTTVEPTTTQTTAAGTQQTKSARKTPTDRFITTTTPEPTDTTASERSRGFISNSGEQSDIASNAVNLTTVGFALSVVGLGHQMIEGR
ncbi:hypothetical protein Huta_1365 [Halorhabdus utahensis DSM 12940]|uniref:Uncharacterized protein n=2 Tax=Halorhabdus utahensis TaxID=146826 RepID=C7NNE1_HALUD|nr:hypothetical protein Huta_1365 [Halorhabdus utahensis DSM 12940]